MPELVLGLAQNKTSYFDKLTNTYITLDKPVQKVTFDANTDLSKLCHAVMCMQPALVLYEGNFPDATVDAWKAKFELAGLKMAGARADRMQDQSADVVTMNVGKVEIVEEEDLFSAAAVNDETTNEVVEVTEVTEEVAEVTEEAPVEVAEVKEEEKPKKRGGNKTQK
jgi:hypothetical protein